MKSRSLIYHPVVAVVCLGVCWMLSSASLSARTLYFTEQDMVGTAVISSDAPELSWAAVPHGAGVYSVGKINLTRNSKLLIRFPVESIPDGYRIVRAELSIPVEDIHTGKDPVLVVRRMQGDWGMGVNYQYRQQLPEAEEWEEMGANGTVKDRAATPSAAVKVPEKGHYRVVVTQDVDMWYTESIPNYGWSVSLEESNASVSLTTCWPTGSRSVRNWQLIVTYEPVRRERPAR